MSHNQQPPISVKLLPLVIPAILLAGTLFSPLSNDPDFRIEGIISVLACTILVLNLTSSLTKTLWAWIILLIFIIGYYIRTYWFAYALQTYSVLTLFGREVSWVTTSTLLRGHYWITLSFVFFCLSSSLLLLISSPQKTRANIPIRIQNAHYLILSMIALSILINFLQNYLNIGILGVKYQRLPYRIDTIIFRMREDIIPALLLLSIWVLDGKRSERKWWLIGLTSLSLHIIMGSLVVTSRGGLVVLGFYIVILWSMTNQITANRRKFLGLLVAMGVLSIPFATNLRLLRIANASLTPISTIKQTINQVLLVENYVQYGTTSLQYLMKRIGGAEGIWFSSTAIPDTFSFKHIVDIALSTPIHIYYTRHVVGITNPYDFRAPGIVGAFMLMGGELGVVLFTIATVIIVFFFWRWASRFQTAPVVLTILSFYILELISEGKLVFQNFIVLLFSILLCEFVFRRFLRVRNEDLFNYQSCHSRESGNP